MPDGSDGQVAACDYCRRRKIRCDRIKPTCGSCVSSVGNAQPRTCCGREGHPVRRSERSWKLPVSSSVVLGRTVVVAPPPTSLGSGAASKQQEDLLRKVKEAAGTRTRSNSTNNAGDNASSSAATAAAAALVAEAMEADAAAGGNKNSWMEMLSIATQSANPFADSPASSPSDISAHDTFHIDAGACDYIFRGEGGVAPFAARSA